MKYLKLFEDHSDKIFDPKTAKEPGFDKIYLINEYDIDIYKSQIKELNDRNDNFDPLIIKDLFLDFYDYEKRLILDEEITKLYKLTKSTRTTDDETTDAYYLSYRIQVKFTLEKKYTYNFLKLREEYLKERDSIRDILHEHYGLKSLNYELNEYNYFNTELGHQVFTKDTDEFDLWSKSLWL